MLTNIALIDICLQVVGLMVVFWMFLKTLMRVGVALQLFEIRLSHRKRLKRALDGLGLSPITQVRRKQLGEIDELERQDLQQVALGRRIVSAANLYESKILVLGVRHCDGIMTALVKAHLAKGIVKNSHDHIQGFVDNKGNFLTREEAWDIAVNAGQIVRRVGGDNGRLYSENLY